MFCSNCGNRTQDGDLWCIKCGSRLEAQETENVENQNEAQHLFEESCGLRSKKRIKDYFGRSLFSALFGSISLGAVAVIFSGMTRTELTAGDSVRADSYSEKARTFCTMSFAVGIVKLLCVAAVLLSCTAIWAVRTFF